MSDDQPKISLVTEDRFSAVIRAFMASPKFQGYALNTRKTWGAELLFMSRPGYLGDLSRFEIRPALVQAYFDGLAGRPGKQSAAYGVLKALEGWAMVRDLLPREILKGVEIEELDGGHIPWSMEHVDLAETYARSDLARVVTLGANTGQRGSDLIRMSWTDVSTFDGRDGIRLTQKKTGRDLWVPILATLAAAMKTWERRPGPFLARLDGRPWDRHDLTNTWTKHRKTNPMLEPLRAIGPDKDKPAVLHGLRGHACVRLVRWGCNTRQVADIVGMSEPMVANYTRFSSQQENASAAVHNIETLQEHRAEKNAKRGS